MFDYNDHLSPIIRSTSAPLIMDQNDRALEFKHGTPVALYTSLSQTGHFQGLLRVCHRQAIFWLFRCSIDAPDGKGSHIALNAHGARA